jgi:ubiquinone/menaquinone biosynthesis C-methylase UbiE
VWARQDTVRRAYVREMFGRVAPRYDLLNGILSLQLHHSWRRMVVRMLRLCARFARAGPLHGHGRPGD